MTASPRPSRRKEDKELRRRRIIEGAIQMVEAEGVSGLSLHKLAKSLGYTVGALYRYYDNKDALIAALQCEGIDALGRQLANIRQKLGEWMDTHALDTPLRGVVGLCAIASFYREYMLRSPGIFHLNGMLMSDPRPLLSDDAAQPVMMSTVHSLEHVVSYLSEAHIESHTVSGFERALVFWSSIHGIVQLNKLMRMAPETWSHRTMYRDAISALLVGWGASHPQVEEAYQLVEQWERHAVASQEQTKQQEETKQ